VRAIWLVGALRLAVAAIWPLASIAPTWADGSVVRATGCGDKLFVSSVRGFSVLTGVGGSGVAEKDELVGEVDKIGYTQLYDKTLGRNFSARVEEHQLDRAAINQRIGVACRGFNARGFATATVVRTEGCGNKIIVAGTDGYAVLERLAGGVVAKDDSLSGDFNKPGRATVKDKQNGATLTVFVEDYQISRAAAERKMRRICTTNR